MPVESYITDPENGKQAAVDDAAGGEKRALVAATRDLKTYENKIKHFFNETYGIEMNQAVTFGGTPDPVHDGTDKTQWTASAVLGTWTFNTANTHAKEATVTIVDYDGTATDTVTVTVDSTATVLTEGTEWNRGASNEEAATSLASAIDALDGVSASASGAVVTIIADDGYDVTALATSDATNITVSARAVDATAAANDDAAQFARPSSIDLSGYTAITGYVYITGWSAVGTTEVELYGWDTATSLQVGSAVNLGDYVDTGILNEWHKFTIPLGDMDLSGETIDALRVRTVAIGTVAPNYYLDFMRIEEMGTPLEYRVEPEKGTWLHVAEINISMVDAYAGTLADATMPSLPYNAWLGVSKLASGMIYRRIQDGKISFSIIARQLYDFLQLPGTGVIGCGSDGTNTWVALRITMVEPLVLKAEDGDYLSLSFSDDLSGLLQLRAAAGCKEEQR